MEFADAKDRLKHSWAADREDFARVKEQLKKKNAEHHVQNGRLSQALKVGLCCCILPWPHNVPLRIRHKKSAASGLRALAMSPLYHPDSNHGMAWHYMLAASDWLISFAAFINMLVPG